MCKRLAPRTRKRVTHHACNSDTQTHHASQAHMHHTTYMHMHHTSATHTTVPHTQVQHTSSTHIRITHHACLINEVLGLPQSLASSQMTPRTALAHHLQSFLGNLHLAKMGARRAAPSLCCTSGEAEWPWRNADNAENDDDRHAQCCSWHRDGPCVKVTLPACPAPKVQPTKTWTAQQ